MQKYQLRQSIDGYITNTEETDEKIVNYLVSGSQNVLIDPRFSKVGSRGGYSRLGAANTALKPVRNKFDWLTSVGNERNMRWYDDELEVYLETIDGVEINAWTRVLDGLSTTAILRACTWWDNTEKLDVMLFVNNDDNIYKWGGGVATIKSATADTITKNGTNTWGENGFLTSGTRKVLIDGTEYTYTGGEGTTTLTGVTPDPSGESVDSVATQTVITSADKPSANRTNNYIFNFENHIFVGSDTDNLTYMSKSSDYTDYTYSSPRIAGEGGVLTLDGTTKGFSLLSKVPIIFSGEDSIFTVDFETITVGTTLCEAIKVRKLKNGSRQGAYNQETIISIGDSIIYLSNEPALRMLDTVGDADVPQLKSLSNPIKPDFDNEDWTNACATWHRNRYYLSAPNNSKLYILDYVETADGKLKRFWQPPQILPVRALSVIDGVLYGHSNSNPETYLLFNGTSDGVYDGMAVVDKLPISAIAKFSYRVYGDRSRLKCFDSWYITGNISASTDDLKLTLNYGFGGSDQQLEFTIDGTDENILSTSLLASSLGQQPLGSNPLGGTIQDIPELSRFKIILEMPKFDFSEIQEEFSSNDVDKSWEIITSGGSVEFSKNRDTVIMQ